MPPNPVSARDRVRREVGRNGLRARNGIRLAAGTARPDLGQTPKYVMWREGRCELWRYRNDEVRVSPPLLIIYSLFNRSYILDLRPGNSFVERLLAAGFDVFPLDLSVLTTPADLQQLGPLGDLLGVASLDVDTVLDPDGNVPPRIILQGFRSLTPTADVTRYVNLLEQLWSDEYLAADQAMGRRRPITSRCPEGSRASSPR